jgi:hypothetical protein
VRSWLAGGGAASSHDVAQAAPPWELCADGVVSAAGPGSGSASVESIFSYVLEPQPREGLRFELLAACSSHFISDSSMRRRSPKL